MLKRLGSLGLQLFSCGFHASFDALQNGVQCLGRVVEISHLEALGVAVDQMQSHTKSVGRDEGLFAEGILSKDHRERAEYARLSFLVRVVIIIPAEEAVAKGIKMPERLNDHVEEAVISSCSICEAFLL